MFGDEDRHSYKLRMNLLPLLLVYDNYVDDRYVRKICCRRHDGPWAMISIGCVVLPSFGVRRFPGVFSWQYLICSGYNDAPSALDDAVSHCPLFSYLATLELFLP